MARYAQYVDSDYLPGDLRTSGLDEYNLYPMLKTDYMANKLWKFQPQKDDSGESFQTFLALQNNPEALFRSKMQLPQTPFGNLSEYLGV